ncbi:MAG: hypothetical protein V1750_02580 [Acidobacteriota bacterium]
MSERRLADFLMLILMTLIAAAPAAAQQGEPAAPAAPAATPSELLPLFGVDFPMPAEWVDAAAYPSASPVHPHAGVAPALQQTWEALRADGFNVLRVGLEVEAPERAAVQLANLCTWAQGSGAMLLPVLRTGGRTQGVASDWAEKAASTVAGALTLLRGGGQSPGAYTQILAFQLGERMNHPGWHGGMAAATGQLRLVQAAGAVRRAEQEALAGTSLAATPLVAGVSFDYELVRAGGGAGSILTDEMLAAANGTMRQFLAEAVSAPEIDAINLEWFPGSMSAGGVDRFGELLGGLQAALPGKQLSLTTGFSTSFHSPEEARQFYLLTFTNLSDHRASEGEASQFVGVIFHRALDGFEPPPQPPSPDLPAAVAGWDWSARTAELARMWSGEAASPVLSWWEAAVASQMGLFALQQDAGGATHLAPLAGHEALALVAESVSGAASAPEPQAAAPTMPDAAATLEASGGSFGTALKETAKVGALTLLARVFENLGSHISFGGGDSGGGSGGGYPSGGGYESASEPPPPAQEPEAAAPPEESGETPAGGEAPAAGEAPAGGLQPVVPGLVLGGARAAQPPAGACRPAVKDVFFGGRAATPAVGKTAVTAALVNPCTSAAKGLTATLLVNGKRVQSKEMKLLFPRQSRSVVFSDVHFPKPKKVEVTVALETGAGKKRTQLAAWKERLVVREADLGVVGTAVLMRPGGGAAASSTGGARATGSSALSTRSLVPAETAGASAKAHSARVAVKPPPTATPRMVPAPPPTPFGGARSTSGKLPMAGRTPAATAPPAPTRAALPAAVIMPVIRPQPTPRPTKAAAIPVPNLALAARDITVGRPSRAGDPLKVKVTVHNLGTARAAAARVLCVLRADGREVARKEFTFAIDAGGQTFVQWAPPTPAGKQLRLEVTASAAGETARGDNQAALDLPGVAAKVTKKR